ncbi:SDR family oxidoreductase [Salaquimonas pukyongi]|uniref:SDR family oxidoreductase n=1 Tax=Salaquimonas pukyongi TaxID=2712698 RepID=UPI00096B99F2|nr:SDR family oxidoreductase [Salaquimonas pukyongi]
MAGVIVITGGSRGIGAACAKLAAEAGYDVCLNYRSNAKAADGMVSQIAADGGRAKAVAGDVGDNDDVIALFKAADEMGQVKGLINNAGILDVRARVDEMPPERLERIMRVNILGSFFCAREAVRRMSTAKGGEGGAIVNLSSAAARLGAASQYVDYAASKGAIDTFTRGLALEVAGEGIRVNGVRPGIIDTDIHASGGEPDRARELRDIVPVKREGTAEEVAQAVLWLMSGKASYVTGATLDVTGGR